jgi:cob(I)alamin adenosyltransferase
MSDDPKVPESEAEHRARMEKLQAEMREKVEAAREKRGLVIVHTGNGKGKTTAAFGMLARMLAHGRGCAVVQFIKSGGDAVEKLLRGPLLRWHRVGDGFTWDTQNRAADIASCREGWRLVCEYLQDPAVSSVLLDELNVALAFEYLPKDEVLAALRSRRPGQHVVITGRGALPEIMDYADLVTEMKEIKHPFNAGVQAQLGIEF